MSAGNRHLVERQVLELELASEAGALGLQEQAAEPFRDGGTSRLQELFDNLAGPGETLRFDRLELDLGELKGPDWQALFFDRLASRLREEVARARTPAAPAETIGEPPPAGVQDFRRLLFFLAHGRLPWWARKPEGGWSDPLPAEPTRAQWRELGSLIGRDERARRRLVLTLGDRFLAAAAVALADLRRAAEALEALAPPEVPARYWRRAFWQAVVDFVAADGDGQGRGRGLMRRLLAERETLIATRRGGRRRRGGRPPPPADTGQPAVAAAGRARPADGPQASSTAPDAPGEAPEGRSPPLPRPWRAWLEAAIREGAAIESQPLPPAAESETGAEPAAAAESHRPPAIEPAAAEPAGGDSPQVPAAEDRRGAEPPPAASGGPVPGPAAGLETGEAIYLDGAGAVLVHPFLEELFGSRELLAERMFRDEQARCHAVHLLGYLAFGHDRAAEHELLLAKLLCGMPWTDPLPPGELSDDDRDACGELLSAVLEHWQALRSASPEWLRQQYFLREGRVEAVDDGWKLTVERRAQDVLLGKLPWGLGLVRLPWMPSLLYVSWMD